MLRHRPHEIIISDRTGLSSPIARDHHLYFLILMITAIGHGGHSDLCQLAHVIQLHSFLLKVLFDNIQAEASTPDDGMF